MAEDNVRLALGSNRQFADPLINPTITVAWEFLTPDKAEEYLGLNFEHNRRRSQTWVDRLAAMMGDGEFRPTHQGIAFDENGFLIDGQYRLAAINQSGCGQWLLVARGLKREGFLTIDRGEMRRDADQIRVSTNLTTVTQQHTAIASAMIRGAVDPFHGHIPMAFLADFMPRYWDSLEFVTRHGASKGFSAIIRAAVAKAYYHVEGEYADLNRFMNVFVSGMATSSKDAAAIKLRNHCMESRQLHGTMGQRFAVMRRALTAIEAFLEGRSLLKLYEASKDSYPLPDYAGIRKTTKHSDLKLESWDD